jgi:hypothetical protein
LLANREALQDAVDLLETVLHQLWDSG